MRVLGIDPGYAIVGWGVVEYAGNRFAPVDFGAVCTDAGVPGLGMWWSVVSGSRTLPIND